VLCAVFLFTPLKFLRTIAKSINNIHPETIKGDRISPETKKFIKLIGLNNKNDKIIMLNCSMRKLSTVSKKMPRVLPMETKSR